MCDTNVLWIDNEMEYTFKLVIFQKNFLVCIVREGRKLADSDKFPSYIPINLLTFSLSQLFVILNVLDVNSLSMAANNIALSLQAEFVHMVI